MIGITLFSTSISHSYKSDELTRLIESIEAVRSVGIQCKLFLLLQGCSPQSEGNLLNSFPDWTVVSLVESKMPLSSARNLMLNIAFSQGKLTHSDIVGFPDDDCWYLPETIRFIQDTFRQDDRLDFFFCRYSSNPRPPTVSLRLKQPRLQEVISRASSNTIFLRGNLINQLRQFEEDLGVGTSLNGGEDTEYAIRAFLSARKTLFADDAIVGHRDADLKIRAKYFAGSFIAIKRNAKTNFRVKIALIRKFFAGILFISLGKLDLHTFSRALRE